MDSQILYFSGEEVKAGDRVQLAGTYATVVFVSNGETYEFSPGYEDHAGSDRGVVICDDDGGISSLGEPGVELVFVDRG
jgi:hypothetical protein